MISNIFLIIYLKAKVTFVTSYLKGQRPPHHLADIKIDSSRVSQFFILNDASKCAISQLAMQALGADIKQDDGLHIKHESVDEKNETTTDQSVLQWDDSPVDIKIKEETDDSKKCGCSV